MAAVEQTGVKIVAFRKKAKQKYGGTFNPQRHFCCVHVNKGRRDNAF